MKLLKLIFLLLISQTILASDDIPQSAHLLEQAYTWKSTNTDSFIYYIEEALYYSAQENNDDIYTLSKTLKAYEFIHTQKLDSTNVYFQELIQEVSTLNISDSTKMKVFYDISYYTYYINDYKSSLQFLDSTRYYAKRTESTLYIGKSYNWAGAVYDQSGDTERSLKSYLKAMEIFKSLDEHSYDYAVVKANTAITYSSLKEYDKALSLMSEAVEQLKKYDNINVLALSKNNKGSILKGMGRYSSAIEEIKEARTLFYAIDNKYRVNLANKLIGECFLLQEEYDSSLYYILKSIDSFEEDQLIEDLNDSKLTLAKVYNSMGEYAYSNDIALALVDEFTLSESLEEVSMLIAENYEKQQLFDQALTYFEKYKVYSDSVIKKESTKQMEYLQVQLDLKQKEEDIENLSKEKLLQASLAQESIKKNNILIVSLLLLLVISVFLIMLYKRKSDLSDRLQKRKSALEQAQHEIIEKNAHLVTLNQEKDDIISMVAHDLRSPLNQIRGLLGLMKMELHEENRHINEALQSSELLTKKINKMLDVEAINEGKIDLNISQVPVNQILEQIKQQTYQIAHQKEINLKIEQDQNIECKADSNYLIQILEKLCDNAIQFSPFHSEVLLSAKYENGFIQFKVKDQGVGIDQEEQKLLFTRYSKVSDSEKSHKIGLAIIKKYVEAMSGCVWCESEVDKGSTFFIQLPAV